MTVISSSEAPTFDTGHAVITGLASPSRGSSQTSAWRVRLQPGQSSPVHSLDAEEVFVVIEGELVASFDGREESAQAGDALIVHAGEPFSLRAEGTPVEAVCMLPVGARARVAGELVTPPWAA